MPRDIDGLLDDIDRLVDEQLAAGPVDDYNADRYDRCPHCHRQWHGIAITERVEQMRWLGRYDGDYRVVDDDSRVLCPGSDFIGPMQATLVDSSASVWAQGGQILAWTRDLDVLVRALGEGGWRDVGHFSSNQPSLQLWVWDEGLSPLAGATPPLTEPATPVTVPSADRPISPRRRERQKLRARARQQGVEADRRRELLDRIRTATEAH